MKRIQRHLITFWLRNPSHFKLCGVNDRVPPLISQTKMQLRLRPSRLRQSSVVFSTLRGSSPCQTTLCLRLQRRSITAHEKPLPERDTPRAGPNQEQLPHVSEEASITGKISGEGGPDLEQGTPVQEVRDTLCIQETNADRSQSRYYNVIRRARKKLRK